MGNATKTGTHQKGKTMNDVNITTTDNMISTTTPYDRDFIYKAKKLGGKWNPTNKTWDFDSRDRARVEKILTDLFGYKPTNDETTTSENAAESNTVTLRINGKRWDGYNAIRIAGRDIAKKLGRDSLTWLADKVVIVEGDFELSGGSMRYPELAVSRHGVILEWRDVPAEVAAKAVADYPKSVTIIDGQTELANNLRAEKAQLEARLAEITAALDALQQA